MPTPPSNTREVRETTRITSIASLLEFAWYTTAVLGGEPAFRGQSKHFWCLRPRLYRPEFSENHDFERNLLSEFGEFGPSRVPDPPHSNDQLYWLILAGHHNLPTRLLDWTWSPLIGLYFAVCNQKHYETDGKLWAIELGGVSHLQPDVSDRDRERLIANAFSGTNTHVVAPMRGFQRNARIAAQQGRFTIHGDSTILTDWPNIDQILTSAIVPSE